MDPTNIVLLKGENPLRGQIGPIKSQNIKNIQERVITPQYNVEVL